MTPSTLISDNFHPNQSLYELAANRDIPIAFVDAEIDEFIFFWTNQKTRRKDWQGTFWNRIKALWSYKKEAERRTVGTHPSSNTEWVKPEIKVSTDKEAVRRRILEMKQSIY